jgi:ComF family protein
MIRDFVDPLVSLIYPQQCHVCRGPVESMTDGVACGNCWRLTRLFDGSQTLCEKCGALISDSNGGGTKKCNACRDAHFDRAVSAGVYELALAATVIDLKKVPQISARPHEVFMKRVEGELLTDNAVLVPVPLSKRRRFERGYNQAEILAKALSRKLGLAVYPTCLIRTTHTQMHRIAMDKKAREATVAKAFEVAAPRLIEGREVILVDDVLTSGATASACARVLKKSGAAKVTVVTLARAVMR